MIACLARVLPVLLATLPAVADGLAPASRPASGPAPRPASSPSEYVVPVDRADTLLLVNVRIGSSGPHRFMVDTGAASVMLHARLAERLALPDAPTPVTEVLSPKGRLPAGRTVSIERLELGPVVFRDLTAAVMDLAAVREMLGEPVEGILGMNVFADWLVTLDYRTPALRLSRGSLPEPDGREVLGLQVFAGMPVIVIGLMKAEIETIVDSGANGGLLLPRSLRDRLRYAVKPAAVGSSVTAGGTVECEAARLSDPVRIGRYVLERPVVDLEEGPPRLGGEVLKDFEVTFDLRSQRVRFSRDGEAPILSEPYRTVGLSMARKPQGWTVTGVVPNTPASRAGLTPGDVLIRYDNRPGETLTFAIWRRLLEHGGLIPCRFQRGGERYDVSLRQAVLVP